MSVGCFFKECRTMGKQLWCSWTRWSSLYPQRVRGRPRLLNAQTIDDLHHLIQESPYLFLDEIGEWLALYHDQPISTMALHDNLRGIGLTWKVMRKVTTECDPVARAEWLAYVTSKYSAEQMVILDESSKDGRTIARRFGHAPGGERLNFSTVESDIASFPHSLSMAIWVSE